MSTLLEKVRAVGRYLHSIQSIGPDIFTKTVAEQQKYLLSLLGRCEVDIGNVSEISEALKALPLTADQCKPLIEALSDALAREGEKTSKKTQEYLNLPNFFNRQFWVLGRNMTQDDRLATVLAVSGSLNLRHPNEHSQAMIMYLAMGEDVETLNGPQRHALFKACKTRIKSFFKTLPVVPKYLLLQTLPSSFDALPDEIKDNAHELSRDCIACPLLAQLKAMALSFNVRNSSWQSKDLMIPSCGPSFGMAATQPRTSLSLTDAGRQLLQQQQLQMQQQQLQGSQFQIMQQQQLQGSQQLKLQEVEAVDSKKKSNSLFEKLRNFSNEEKNEIEAEAEPGADVGSEAEVAAATELTLTLPVKRSAAEVATPAGAEGAAAATLATLAEVGKLAPAAETQPAKRTKLSPSEAIDRVRASMQERTAVGKAQKKAMEELEKGEKEEKPKAGGAEASEGMGGKAGKAEKAKALQADAQTGKVKAEPKPEKAEKRQPAAVQKSSAEPAEPLILGCSRCRGSQSGCSSCQKPTFSGMRFGSHEAWEAWYNAKDPKDKKDKKAVPKAKSKATAR